MTLLRTPTGLHNTWPVDRPSLDGPNGVRTTAEQRQRQPVPRGSPVGTLSQSLRGTPRAPSLLKTFSEQV